jgi:osomolarity two-component system response regulator SKN7
MVRLKVLHLVFAADSFAGMDDVLPKPFTKDGLLLMLEKHLGHLKKLPDGMDMVPNTASTLHGSNTQSVKDEASPGHSPSTVSNWNSPGQFSGISPTVSNQFMQQVPNPTGYNMDHNQMQFQQPQQPQTPLGAPPRPMNHRRQISELGNVDDMGNDPKRPRIYAQTNAAMNTMRRGPG